MAQTYKQIQKQIEQLQRQAEALRSSEVKGVVDRIKVAIANYGLTAEQLGLGTNKPAARSKKIKKASGKSGAKFSDGNGNAWSGRGPRPGWLREALTSGRSIEEFRVGSHKKSTAISSEMALGETAAPATRRARKKAKRAASKTYRDDAGNSWSGFGPKPRWLKAQLDAGKSLEDFAQ